jgi:hypothetical protein
VILRRDAWFDRVFESQRSMTRNRSRWIPHFIPVIGLADNAVAIPWALRSVVRVRDPSPYIRHGPERRLARCEAIIDGTWTSS